MGKQLCGNPKKDDHWALRDFASQLIAYICVRYGESYQTLQPRIAKTMLKAFLDPLRPLPSHFGAILGFRALGREVVRMLLIPNVKVYTQLLDQLSSDSRKGDLKKEAEKCEGALVVLLSPFYFSLPGVSQANQFCAVPQQVVGGFLKEEQQKNSLPKGASLALSEEITVLFILPFLFLFFFSSFSELFFGAI